MMVYVAENNTSPEKQTQVNGQKGFIPYNSSHPTKVWSPPFRALLTQPGGILVAKIWDTTWD